MTAGIWLSVPAWVKREELQRNTSTLSWDLLKWSDRNLTFSDDFVSGEEVSIRLTMVGAAAPNSALYGPSIYRVAQDAWHLTYFGAIVFREEELA